jgi:hypothetical protein
MRAAFGSPRLLSGGQINLCAEQCNRQTDLEGSGSLRLLNTRLPHAPPAGHWSSLALATTPGPMAFLTFPPEWQRQSMVQLRATTQLIAAPQGALPLIRCGCSLRAR